MKEFNAWFRQLVFTLQRKKAGSPSPSSKRSEGKERAFSGLAYFLTKSAWYGRSLPFHIAYQELLMAAETSAESAS